jgi:hypothetical protein
MKKEEAKRIEFKLLTSEVLSSSTNFLVRAPNDFSFLFDFFLTDEAGFGTFTIVARFLFFVFSIVQETSFNQKKISSMMKGKEDYKIRKTMMGNPYCIGVRV